MITAQEARETKSDRYKGLIDGIDKQIRDSLKRGWKRTTYAAPYDEDVYRALEEHGFKVEYNYERTGDFWSISWSES